MKKINAFVLIIFLLSVSNAWAQSTMKADNNMPLKFINKVELFAGPSLSFNYGNKFIENYKDENIENKRFLKFGYTAGIGVYHTVSKKVQLNARFQYEQKGRKTELNTPLTSTSRVINLKDYSYNYLTLAIAPQMMFGKNQQWIVSIGGYYGRIRGMKRYEKVENTLDNTTSEGRAEGRSFEDVNSDGEVYTGTWFSGLRSFEANDIGMVFSIGYAIKITGKQKVVIQIVENLGLKNINKDKPFNQEENNHSVSILLSYTLERPLKKH